MFDIYATYAFPRDGDEDVIQAEIKRLRPLVARQYHPDTAPKELRKQYEERLKEVNDVLDRLKDPEERARYNAELDQAKEREIRTRVEEELRRTRRAAAPVTVVAILLLSDVQSRVPEFKGHRRGFRGARSHRCVRRDGVVVFISRAVVYV